MRVIYLEKKMVKSPVYPTDITTREAVRGSINLTGAILEKRGRAVKALLLCAALFVAVLTPWDIADARKKPEPRLVIISGSPARSDHSSPLQRPQLIPSASPVTYVVAEYDFEFNDTQGWSTVDRTAQTGTFFHVDDFEGLGGGSFGRLTPLEGSQSMWCGARTAPPGQLCTYATLPGYGNRWDQLLISEAFSVTGDVELSFRIRYDVEPDYDFVDLDCWLSSPYGPKWTTLLSFNGVGEETISQIIPAADIPDSLVIRFRMTSDIIWSDEDGLYASDGAVIIDSLALVDATGTVYFQDFESETVGATSTDDGRWIGRPPEPYGDYAALFLGGTVLQEDPCVSNITSLWGFFNGSTLGLCDYCPDAFTIGAATGMPDQMAVPGARVTVDGMNMSIDNAIWSPLIDLNKTVSDEAVPVTASHVFLEVDVYNDMPLCQMLGYKWRVRSFSGDCAGVWRHNSYNYFGSGKNWKTMRFELSPNIEPGAERIQISLGVEDYCKYWCIWHPPNNQCHSHGPLFDNIRVVRTDIGGPSWTVADIDLFQDNFAADGTVTGKARVDIAADLLSRGAARIQPGDSAVVTVSDPIYGISFHVPGDSTSGPAVYCHVADVSPVKSGAAISDDSNRWPLAGTADGWTVVRFDTAHGYGGPETNTYCVDLNDNLFTPGDTIRFYYSARDASGRTNYWTQATGPITSENDARTFAMEMTCLPANALSGATDVLYVDFFDGYGAQPAFETAFELLGITPDRFDVRGPVQGEGNSPGEHVKNVVQQLIPFYRTIIWNSGRFHGRGIDDGDWYTKSDDIGMLYEFLDQHPDNCGVYLSGDNLAGTITDLYGTSTGLFRSKYLHYSLLNNSHINVGHPVSPLAIAQPGSPFEHASGPDTLVTFGGCPGINTFDVLQSGDSSVVAMTYSDNPDHGAVVIQSTINPQGKTARVALSGFSYHEIRDDRPETPMDRVDHLRDLLLWIGHVVGPPTAARTAPALTNALYQNHPNPFNPNTTIRLSIASDSHVQLVIYDVAGRRVRTLIDENRRADVYKEVWDGTNNAGQQVATGVYFYRLATSGFVQTRKMLLLK